MAGGISLSDIKLERELILTGDIALSRGLVALVDICDYDALSQFRWQACRSHNNVFYARRSDSGLGCIYMHRVILKAPRNIQVDHIDGNGLNNKRSNLRLADHSIQQINSNRVDGLSKFRGVSRINGRWVARIQQDWSRFNLGNFDTEEEAAIAYNAKATELYGNNAKLNLI